MRLDLDAIQERVDRIVHSAAIYGSDETTDDLCALLAECRRLRALVEKAYKEGWNDCLADTPPDFSPPSNVDKDWSHSDANRVLEPAP